MNDLLYIKKCKLPLGWVLCAKIGGLDIQEKSFVHAWIRSDSQNIGLGQKIFEKFLHFAFSDIKTAVLVANARGKRKKHPSYFIEVWF